MWLDLEAEFTPMLFILDANSPTVDAECHVGGVQRGYKNLSSGQDCQNSAHDRLTPSHFSTLSSAH